MQNINIGNEITYNYGPSPDYWWRNKNKKEDNDCVIDTDHDAKVTSYDESPQVFEQSTTEETAHASMSTDLTVIATSCDESPQVIEPPPTEETAHASMSTDLTVIATSCDESPQVIEPPPTEETANASMSTDLTVIATSCDESPQVIEPPPTEETANASMSTDLTVIATSCDESPQVIEPPPTEETAHASMSTDLTVIATSCDESPQVIEPPPTEETAHASMSTDLTVIATSCDESPQVIEPPPTEETAHASMSTDLTVIATSCDESSQVIEPPPTEETAHASMGTDLTVIATSCDESPQVIEPPPTEETAHASMGTDLTARDTSYDENDSTEEELGSVYEPSESDNEGEASSSFDSESNIHSDVDKIVSISASTNNNSGLVQVVQTMQEGNKRIWNKRYYCLFCEKPQAKLPRHLTTMHKEEHQVVDYLTEKDLKLKAFKLTKLRNLGNHKHNSDVIRQGKGDLIVGYRPNKPAVPNDYGPCENCFVYLVRTDLWKHRCPAINSEDATSGIAKGKRKRLAHTRKLLIPTPVGMSANVHRLLQSMINDDVARVIKNDSLILDLAQREYLKHGHDLDQHSMIRGTLRRIGRLLLQLQENAKFKHPLSYFIDPAHFRNVVTAAKQVAGFNKESNTFSKPSVALKIGQTLKRSAKILQGKSIQEADEDMIKKVKSFHELCELNWTEEISTHALRTLYEGKRNQVKALPLTEDIVRLSKYLKDESKKCKDSLTSSSTSTVENSLCWKKLNEMTLSRIILFNRRRQGEASRIKIDDYQNKPKPNGQKVLLEGLSDVERELCRTLNRIEIRGKKGKTVPILLSSDMIESIDLLLKHRKDVGVVSGNRYLFARSNFGSVGHIRGSDCLRELSVQCGANEPENLRSTKLRKHIATVSQIVNLQENELDILATFMGHDIRVHRQFYRLPSDILQVAKVSKLLLASEQGRTDLAGKSLNEISVSVDDGMYDIYCLCL